MKRRALAEYAKRLEQDVFSVDLVDEKVEHWKVFFSGPLGTNYEGMKIELEVTFLTE